MSDPSRHVVCPADQLPPGTRRMLTLGRQRIGVFNVGGRLFAVRDVCPHRGAPLCSGRVRGAMLPSSPQEYVYDESQPVIRCPWHGYEFALQDGRVLYDPADLRAHVYPVRVEDGDVVVLMSPVQPPGRRPARKDPIRKEKAR